MSATPPKDVVSALVDNQKKIYVQIAAHEASVSSKLREAWELAVHGTFPGAAGDADLLIKLHLFVLAGPRYIQQISTALRDSSPGRAQFANSIAFRGMLLEMEDEVKSKQQWTDGPQGNTFDFEWKVAFSAYAVHSLEVWTKFYDVSGKLGGSMLSKSIDNMIKDRQPFERFLETRMQAASDREKTAWIKACEDLYAVKALRNKLPESFNNAETVFDKAKVLHQAWVEKLGVLASSSKA